MQSEPAAVLYVAGYGRSGSTLLDVVLGNHDLVRGGGELTYLLDEFADPDRLCACRQPYARCPLWAPLVREFGGRAAELAARLRRLDRRSGFLRRWLLPRVGRREDDAAEYRAFQRRLFTHLAADGVRVVVDSSKSARFAAFRPIALRHVAGLQVFVVHLVRSPFDVVRSVAKQSNWQAEGHRPTTRLRVLRTLPGWLLANACAFALRFAVGRRRYLRVGYRQLVDDPARALARIGELLQLDLSQLVATARAGAPFRSGHQAGGNRLRMRPEIVIHGRRAPSATPRVPDVGA